MFPGITTHIGVGHSAVITAARFSSDQKIIVTTSASGSIFIWKFPQDLVQVSTDKIVEETEQPKEEKVDTKDEVIQDLPTSRSDQSKGSDKKGVCRCPCLKKSPCGYVVNGNEVVGDEVKTPEDKPSPKCGSNGSNAGSVKGSGRKI